MVFKEADKCKCNFKLWTPIFALGVRPFVRKIKHTTTLKEHKKTQKTLHGAWWVTKFARLVPSTANLL